MAIIEEGIRVDGNALRALSDLLRRPRELRDWLSLQLPALVGPTITSFSPTSGQRGTVITIEGSEFSAVRADNTVFVGGAPAFVLAAEPGRLVVLTGADTDTGKVEVEVGGNQTASTVEFVVTAYPLPGAQEDGPPVVVQGTGTAPGAGDVNPIGTIRVLVVPLQTTDVVPASQATVRTDVTNRWTTVQTFYDQASYGQTNVQFDVTNFGNLDGTFSDFVDTGSAENIRLEQLPRVAAFAAQTAVDQGFVLNNYAMLCVVVFTNGTFIRAWGGGSQSTFSYDNGKPVGDPARIHIDLTANHAVNTLFINEAANWGRFAHEFGHNIVSAPTSTGDGTATLGEDVYGSDLVDPNAATAEEFELMGDHDHHPIFSGYHLQKLGYYSGANIAERTWDRNPFSETFDIVAHGLSQDSTSRVHIVKVKVSEALSYFIEVRQRPGTTTQVFDDLIPIGGALHQGGVIVTRVIAGEMHNNQQTRFITLMHAPRVLGTNDVVEDPARALRITVVDDNVQARPLVCRVRVEWAQTVVNDPNGAFDLRVEPWDSSWQTPDIWVDRDPFGTFDNAVDSQGRPLGNGDRPRVGQINHFTSRVHVSGAMGATNVRLTYYAVTPPGVGDNGNWAPIATTVVPNVPINGFVDSFTNWVPTVGKHTCLKVYASPQLGEISGSNNSAQENVFEFQSAGGSPCEPVLVRTAIRNPVSEPRFINLELHGIPVGWSGQLPHSWVWLDGLAERELDVAIWPTEDLAAYEFGSSRNDKPHGELPGVANVRVNGHVARDYDVSVFDGEHPGSRFFPIGGTMYRVQVRRRAAIELEAVDATEDTLIVIGSVRPATADQRVVIDLSDSKDQVVASMATITVPSGEFRLALDITKVVAEGGHGTYTVQASVFDADELADATSKPVQLTL